MWSPKQHAGFAWCLLSIVSRAAWAALKLWKWSHRQAFSSPGGGRSSSPMFPEIDRRSVCLTEEQLLCVDSNTETGVEWLNKFIWFTDMYICYQQFSSRMISFEFFFLFFPDTSLALKIKITPVFCSSSEKKVSLYTILVWQEIARSQYITSVIINIELLDIKDFYS